MTTKPTKRLPIRCRPTCFLNGSPYHAFDCPNHPGTIRSPYQHPACSDCTHTIPTDQETRS